MFTNCISCISSNLTLVAGKDGVEPSVPNFKNVALPNVTSGLPPTTNLLLQPTAASSPFVTRPGLEPGLSV